MNFPTRLRNHPNLWERGHNAYKKSSEPNAVKKRTVVQVSVQQGAEEESNRDQWSYAHIVIMLLVCETHLDEYHVYQVDYTCQGAKIDTLVNDVATLVVWKVTMIEERRRQAQRQRDGVQQQRTRRDTLRAASRVYLDGQEEQTQQVCDRGERHDRRPRTSGYKVVDNPRQYETTGVHACRCEGDPARGRYRQIGTHCCAK